MSHPQSHHHIQADKNDQFGGKNVFVIKFHESRANITFPELLRNISMHTRIRRRWKKSKISNAKTFAHFFLTPPPPPCLKDISRDVSLSEEIFTCEGMLRKMGFSTFKEPFFLFLPFFLYVAGKEFYA